MYREFFGLRERPFGITPDTSYFFAFTSYQEALNTLLVAVRTGEGFIKITGEVGTGKTLLCRKFLASLGGDFVTAYIPNPYLEPRTLLMAVAEDLRITVEATADQHHLLRTLTLGLLNYARNGKRVVLCLDEAQAMPLETMEALRLLTNLETEKRKLLQIVLFGQPELDDKLDQASVRQLKQRISFHYRLGELGSAELEAYVAHRLAIAGYAGEKLFTKNAMRLLYRASGGVPRLVNILAHKAMLLAYGQGRILVEAVHVRAAVADTPAARRLGWWWLIPSLGIRG
ncbi:MAG: AAA family ATPase [Gammaproteobacteria bacterium]|nr:AAA family ATPase [Gammaproteobacteria bacterium]MBU1733269.1 AAA family ATPase [Gammaproteobacteria bacterium]MBU1892317.1 AAA family ATPase [Gammaproteobacteria bacterium]